VKPAIKLEPLEGAEPKLKVVALFPELGVMASGSWLSAEVPSLDLAASLQMRALDQCTAAAVNSQNVTATGKN
jgi:hypothetical protein